jgi:hypothetical protein
MAAPVLFGPSPRIADSRPLDFCAALRLVGRNLGGETMHVICRSCGLGYMLLVAPGCDLPDCCETCSSRDIVLTRAVGCCRPHTRVQPPLLQ